MFKHTLPSIIYPIFPSLLWKVKTTASTVYLTFDDGPHPEITPFVLNELAKYGAKATFFCVGDNVRKYPEVYAEVLRQGHTTGNHTFHHVKGWSVSDDEYVQDVSLCAQYVSSNLFRPPYGRIHLSQIKRLRPDYKIVMWTLLTRDYEKNLDTHKALDTITKHIEPGCIIVFHDSEKAYENLRVLLPQVLNFCATKGYAFEALT